MSTINRTVEIHSNCRRNRQHLWLAAAIVPLLIAPLWFALPVDFLTPARTFAGLVLVLLLVCTSFTDLKSRKIYNWASYTAAVWGLLLCVLPHPFSTGSIGLVQSVSGFLTCFVLMLVPYTLARGGAGDVKLAAAIGALLGVGDGLLVIAFAYIIAAICILGWSIIRNGPLSLARALTQKFAAKYFPQYFHAPSMQQKLLLDQPIPLAGFFAAAAIIVVFDIPLLLRSIT